MGSGFCFNNVSVVAGWRIDWKEARLEVEKPIEKGGGCCWSPGGVMVGTNMMKIEVGRYTL